MFSKFVDVLQGPSQDAVDDAATDTAAFKAASEGAAASGGAEPGQKFSIWGMATALAEGVKKTTTDVAARFLSYLFILL